MTLPTPEIHVGLLNQAEPELPLATDGVLRYVWHSRFGEILVGVRDEKSFVNGHSVELASPHKTRDRWTPSAQERWVECCQVLAEQAVFDVRGTAAGLCEDSGAPQPLYCRADL